MKETESINLRFFSTKGRKLRNFPMGLPPATTPLTLMLQTVTASFTLITRDKLPTAQSICGRNIFKFHKYKLKIFRQASKLSDNFFQGGALIVSLPPPPSHGATVVRVIYSAILLQAFLDNHA